MRLSRSETETHTAVSGRADGLTAPKGCYSDASNSPDGRRWSILGRMVALRSSRLEALLGRRLELVEHSDVVALISNQVSEAFDLDFKSEMYAASSKGKHDVANDIAALANTAGGLIILGIKEDDQARAADAPGVALVEEDELRIRQIVGSQVAPMPVFDVRRVEDPARPGHGFVLIAVLRSPLAPHAVIVNDGLRYPRRNGATTRYLSEPEVAAAYRDRFTAINRQADRVLEIEKDALARLSIADDHVWVAVSLVPDLAGETTIDQAALNKARSDMVGQGPWIAPVSSHWMRVEIGRRRLLADGGTNGRGTRWMSADLHEDGSGAFAAYVLDAGSETGVRATGEPAIRRVNDGLVVNGILSGLRFLARHARDRSAAGGNALIRCQLYPVSRQQPLELVHVNNMGFRDALGTRVLADALVPVERVASLEGLASGGTHLASAAYLLATDLFQEFGFPEAAQLTREGAVRLPYWGQESRPRIQSWATSAGVSVTQETLIARP